MSLTLAGLIVRPVGLALAASMAQLPSDEPARVYLNTLLALPSSTTQKEAPSVTMPLGLVSAPVREKLLAALWLPESRLAAPAYLKTLSCLASTSQTSVPLVAIPSTWAEVFIPPA